MFVYEKKLQYPVKIANPNPKYAQIIISQYGGPDGELGASLRYLSQRYAMPYPELKGLLTDIGTEVLEMPFFFVLVNFFAFSIMFEALCSSLFFLKEVIINAIIAPTNNPIIRSKTETNVTFIFYLHTI